jgi:hypothetical protein
MQLNWNLKTFDVSDVRVRRALTECALQLVERGLRTLRNYFNSSIRKIPHEASQVEPLGFTHDKPPEPHTLHSATHDPAPRAHDGSVLRLRRRLT